MVMTIFGRRKHQHPTSSHPIGNHHSLQTETPMLSALLFSTALAIATAMSEEIIFRGLIPTAVVHFTQSIPLALVGQGILFGVGHQSPAASRGENKVISAMQTVSGTWYGAVYLLAGGDILPCIIAHALYDTHILMETWMKINDQMDYTETAVLIRLTKEDEKEIRKIKQEVGSSLSAETLAFLRRFFYAFDYDHAGSLSRSDVQRAISYAFLRDTEQPTEERVNQLFDRLLANRDEIASGEMARRLILPEFLRMILFIRANPSKSMG
jgi:Type II CAAX prenyl endopeptidase Rce1-like